MTLRHVANQNDTWPQATVGNRQTTDPLVTDVRSQRYFLDDQLRYSQAVRDFQHVRQLLRNTALLGLGHWLPVATCPLVVPQRYSP